MKPRKNFDQFYESLLSEMGRRQYQIEKEEAQCMSVECESCCVLDADKNPTCCPCSEKGWKELVKWEKTYV